ncbi:MAG: hypothetical protein NZ853_10755 [Leptospiraceae bacterium]|nr:hypothetical protein [Leptospiraceae bacterium]MDW7977067.1 hypothetical protein [Leptospiraceae bacterium]
MNEPLTKTQAYKIFGELYKKPRPPELKSKVDEIVQKYSDIFVRIQKIQELDLQYQKEKERKSYIEQDNPPTIDVPKINGKLQKTKSKTNFLNSLFKGGEIPRWGERTGTLIHGIFGLNLKLSPNVERSFNLFEEKQIIDFLKSVSFFIHKGWEDFPPSKYNIIITLYQFLQEYLKVPVLFRKQDPVSVIIQQTLKMQVLYANLLLFPDLKKMLEEEFIDWLKKQKEVTPYLANTISVLRILSTLENRRPKFTDIILSFYVLERRKILTWQDLLKELNIRKPVVDRYRAPEKILKIIHQRVEKLKLEIQKREEKIKDIQYIKNKYFLINENGRINTEFLNNIVFYVLRRQYGEQRITKELIKNYISEPHRLLGIITQDFDINFANFFSSTVTIQDVKGQSLDVNIFKPNVFKKEMELFSEILSELNEFLKQYKNAQINFHNFYAAMKNKGSDIIYQNLIKIVLKFSTFSNRMVNFLKVVIANHEEAVELESKGKLKESVVRSKFIPIEEIVIEPRFLPYADSKIIAIGRINNMTVKNGLEELVKNLYNYLYLFRDQNLLHNLSSVTRLESEIQLYKKKLLQYGIE